MNDLETVTITSLEVAEMTGKIHKNLIRSIETYMKHFSQLNFEPTQYFKLSTYLDEQEKERKCYNITKKGCEFIAHKMTGIKGTEFTVKYIERFHEMEQTISQQKVVEQKQEKRELPQWTPEEIVDWKLNDLHKRLQKIERQEEEKPKIGRLQRLVSRKKTWYDRNKSRIWCITRSRDMELKELYHIILEECGRYYDVDGAVDEYRRENGRTMVYPMDLAENYLHQGTKIVAVGRIQTGSYTNKDGHKVYTTEVIVEEQEFAESKAAAAQNGNGGQSAPSVQSGAANNSNDDGFMNIPNGIEEELPFN